MEESPLIDTHIDLPQILRSLHRQPMTAIAQLNTSFPGHVDIPRMRTGRLGAAFWTVWAPCYDVVGDDPGPDFLTPTDHLRDAMEMLDLIQNMIATHSKDFAYARSSADIKSAFAAGKIASLIGMEGTHVLGNSLGTLRLFAQLGVRYLTLTHTCHSAFASSCGSVEGSGFETIHPSNGLSALGEGMIAELNRVGILVDLSHTSIETMRQAITLSAAPVVWTHSGARALQDHPRNVPDSILELIGDGPGQSDGVIQSVFFPPFVGPWPPPSGDVHNHGVNISRVADHIEYLASKIGKTRVGIASDFDGMYLTVEGLEDASKYPNLVAELLRRGWSYSEVKGVMGENLMRIMDKVDAVAEELGGKGGVIAGGGLSWDRKGGSKEPSTAIWEKRTDLPATQWGGGGETETYWPKDVKEEVWSRKGWKHDEL